VKKGEVTPGPQRLGAPPSLKHKKYTRMRHIKKQNSKMLFPDGPPRECFPRPRGIKRVRGCYSNN